MLEMLSVVGVDACDADLPVVEASGTCRIALHPSGATELHRRSRLTVHIVARDAGSRAQISRLVFEAGHHAEIYADIGEFLSHAPERGIVIINDDARDDTALLTAMNHTCLPVIVTSEAPAVRSVVTAMRAGAVDYLAAPLASEDVYQALDRVSAMDLVRTTEKRARVIRARKSISNLSKRENEVLRLLVAGQSNKGVARELAISPRTVEIHRSKMMSKLGARCVADAVRIGIDAYDV